MIVCACVYRFVQGFPTPTPKGDLKIAKDQDVILVGLMLQEAVGLSDPALTIEFEIELPNNYGRSSTMADLSLLVFKKEVTINSDPPLACNIITSVHHASGIVIDTLNGQHELMVVK